MDILNFDAISAIDSSARITSKDDFVNDILPKVQAILNRMFPDKPAKRKIRIYPDRISFAAPCCGDSAHDSTKKRGNIVLEGKFRNMYKCFNCGCCMSLPKFFKQYGQDLTLSEIDYISKTKIDLENFRNSVNTDAVSYLYDTKKIDELAVEREYFKGLLELSECSEKHFGRDYLIKRKQFNFEKFLYSIKANKLFVLNLTPSGKIFGLQVRNFSGDVKYKTYNLQKIHEMILRDNVEVPDEINTLSMLFNILLVNYNAPVNILEGPMDSFLLRNSVALCGASKSMEFPFEHRYIFDDDKAGRDHAIEKLREGYGVFMWSVLKKDLGINVKGKLDINDLLLWCDDHGKKFPVIDKYFTDDVLDLVLI